MTPDQVDKAIQFLLEQQAAFEASLQRNHELFEERWKKLEERLEAQSAKTDAQILKTDLQIQRTDSLIGKNSQQIEKNSQQIEKNSAQIAQLAEEVGTVKDACRDLLEHSGYTDFRLNRLENPGQ